MSSPTQENEQQVVQRQKMALTADLLRRGATLLGETCPRCGGLQLRYKDHTYCVNEDDIEQILYPKETPPQRVDKKTATIGVSSSDDKESLKRLLREKLNSASKELHSTIDVDRQSKLLDLISKYVEVLSKLE